MLGAQLRQAVGIENVAHVIRHEKPKRCIIATDNRFLWRG
jgi:hypothetical protein